MESPREPLQTDRLGIREGARDVSRTLIGAPARLGFSSQVLQLDAAGMSFCRRQNPDRAQYHGSPLLLKCSQELGAKRVGVGPLFASATKNISGTVSHGNYCLKTYSEQSSLVTNTGAKIIRSIFDNKLETSHCPRGQLDDEGLVISIVCLRWSAITRSNLSMF